jgi:hypothetical protein
MAIIKTKFNRGIEGATNIVDAGTEGTKVAVGTTAQRGSTPGQWRFNTTTGFFEGINTSGGIASLEPTPIITSVDVNEIDSNGGGNQTIVVTGINFSSGGVISFIGSSASFNASSTTFNSVTQVTVVAPKSSFLNAQEPYSVKFTSASGLSGSSTGIINVDSVPTFNVASGTLGTLLDTNRASSGLTTITATDPDGDNITFTKTSGTIPTGITLNSNGTWSGTANTESSNTTYNFTITATANTKTTNRAYSITVNKPIIINLNMLIAGGGGGGSFGGGGAGGYRTSSETNVSTGTVITVVVGQGGNGRSTNNTTTNGGASSIAGSGITNITSAGGGAGGGISSNVGNANSGASGGGGGHGGSSPNVGGSATPTTSPVQGHGGGTGRIAPNYAGGGGGGAGSAGATATGTGQTSGGAGGAGVANSISGSSLFYCSGGGGSYGGVGGSSMGNDAESNGTNGVNAAPNRGLGGPGGNGTGRNGGSGVVIISTTHYSGTSTGSPTITTSGGNTILTFTGSGSYTT